MTLFVGIDPGAKGSLCLLDTATKKVVFQPTPCLKAHPVTIHSWLVEIHAVTPIHMIGIEDVHAIYGTSAGSNFKFGYNTGLVTAVAQCTGIGVERITPKVWQKKIGVPQAAKGKKRKLAIANIALSLYPFAELYGPKGGLLDGRADALMLAHYMALRYAGDFHAPI